MNTTRNFNSATDVTHLNLAFRNLLLSALGATLFSTYLSSASLAKATSAPSKSQPQSQPQNQPQAGDSSIETYATNELYKQLFKSISKSKFGLASRFEADITNDGMKIHEFALFLRTALEQDLSIDLSAGAQDVSAQARTYIPTVHAGLADKLVIVQIAAKDPTHPSLLQGTLRFKDMSQINSLAGKNKDIGLLPYAKINVEIFSKNFTYKKARLSGIDFQIQLPSAEKAKSKSELEEKVLSMMFDCKAETEQLNKSMIDSQFEPLETCHFTYTPDKNNLSVDIKEQVPEWAR